MSFFSGVIDALKKAFGRKPEVDIEQVRSAGGLGSTPPTDAFDPLRPAPQSGGQSAVEVDELSVSSGDPEEGGEYSGPHGPVTG
jgi:hypothetical protein